VSTVVCNCGLTHIGNNFKAAEFITPACVQLALLMAPFTCCCDSVNEYMSPVAANILQGLFCGAGTVGIKDH